LPVLGGLLDGLSRLGGLTGSGVPLPLPTVPGLPAVPDQSESAQVSGPGTRLRITLGDVRQASEAGAIGARATAFTIAISQGPEYGQRPGVVLDLKVGVLEAAAVAPATRGSASGVDADNDALPITGPHLGGLVLGGGALLAVGFVVVGFGIRRRRRFQA
jgi:hypothetical protein